MFGLKFFTARDSKIISIIKGNIKKTYFNT